MNMFHFTRHRGWAYATSAVALTQLVFLLLLPNHPITLGLFSLLVLMLVIDIIPFLITVLFLVLVLLLWGIGEVIYFLGAFDIWLAIHDLVDSLFVFGEKHIYNHAD